MLNSILTVKIVFISGYIPAVDLDRCSFLNPFGLFNLSDEEAIELTPDMVEAKYPNIDTNIVVDEKNKQE